MARQGNYPVGDENPRALGPKMRDLHPRHRLFVVEYCKCGNATQAARAAGYKDNGGNSIRVMACKLLARKDVAEAVVEDTVRRLAASMPVHLGLVQRLAEGKTNNDLRPVSHNVQLKALELMIDRGGLGPKMQIEHTGEIQVTVRDRWERIARQAAARGEDPKALLANLPDQDRQAILIAIAKEDVAGAEDAEFEEVENAKA